MFNHHDLDKKVTVVFRGGTPAVRGRLTDYDDVNGLWLEVSGASIGVDASWKAARHLMPLSGMSYIRFEHEEEEKP